MRVIYKRKIWNVLCPADLKFPDNCIRNLLIERSKIRVITHINDCKIYNTKSRDITSFC